MNLKCDAVFEGGGVRGIGHVGAANALQKAGYSFENLAGSSCGAIVAGLLAVGYKTTELKHILKSLDYTKFETPTKLHRIGTPGKIINIILNYGIYSSSYFEEWFAKLLTKKGKTTFGDLKANHPSQEKYKYKLQVTASDLTTQQLLTLPQDLVLFGIDPDSFPIAKAVRMSMSIPGFYMPYVLKDTLGVPHYIVDGGMLSNYPIWMLDDGTSNPPFPTFGFKFYDDSEGSDPSTAQKSTNIITYSQSIISTLISAVDNQHISESKGDLQRSILIPITINQNGKKIKIKSTDFSITKEESEAIFQNGYTAAENFLFTWNFEAWKRKYR